MTTVAPDLETSAITPLVIPADRRPDSWEYAQSHLQHLETIVSRTAKGTTAYSFTDPDGHIWRRAGELRIQEINGVRAFRITLFHGATDKDLTRFKDQVDFAKRGFFLDYGWKRVTADWANEHTFKFWANGFENDDRWDLESQTLVDCDEPRCMATIHEEWDRHILDAGTSVTRRYNEHLASNYRIEVCRHTFEDTDWYVDIYTDEFYGTPTDVASFVNDVEWARQECEKANQERGVRR